MSDNHFDFVKNYGGLTFEEMPFTEADNACICGVFYMPIEKAAPHEIDDEPVPLKSVFEKMYELNGNKHVTVGLVLLKWISKLMMEMAKSKRYGDVKITYVKSVFAESPAVQFAAATLLLPDGTIVIPFRGTDDSYTGWVEDLDIYTKKGIPSHQLAVDYINAVAEKFEGDIIVCGHSKGGNVALYGAMNCNKKAKARIKAVYNNDGPGFHSFDYINTPEYRELLPRYKHFVPNSSLIGMLLAHDDDFTVVKSRRLLGPTQHDISTWTIDGTEFQRKKQLTKLARVADLSLLNILLRVSDEQGEVLENVLNTILKGTGQDCLSGFGKNAFSAVNGAVKAWKGLDATTKAAAAEVFKDSATYIRSAIRLVREDAIPAVQKTASNIVNTFMA